MHHRTVTVAINSASSMPPRSDSCNGMKVCQKASYTHMSRRKQPSKWEPKAHSEYVKEELSLCECECDTLYVLVSMGGYAYGYAYTLVTVATPQQCI